MMVLGITGGVGAGKSTVLDYMKEKYQAVILQADLVCDRFVFFCGDYGCFSKMRHSKDKFKCCDSNPDDRRVTFFMAYGLSDRSTDRFNTDQ